MGFSPDIEVASVVYNRRVLPPLLLPPPGYHNHKTLSQWQIRFIYDPIGVNHSLVLPAMLFSLTVGRIARFFSPLRPARGKTIVLQHWPFAAAAE